MSDLFPLKVFYDASCAVCRFEMEQLRRRDTGRRLVLVDMSAAGFDAGTYGLAGRDLDAVIHALRPDGTVLRGVPVLRLCYEAVGLGWVWRPSTSAALAPVFDAGYRLFARHRRRISRALGPVLSALDEQRARRVLARMRGCTAAEACGMSDAPAKPGGPS